MKRKICLFLYIFIVLGFTVFFRRKQMNPLGIVWEGWTFHRKDGTPDLNPLYNILMLIPFGFLLICSLDENTEAMSRGKVIAIAGGVSFLFSMFIELMQIMTRLGTFQISDLTYNTLSGIIGACIFLVMQCVSGKHSR